MNAIVIHVRSDGAGGFEVHDALGRSHCAADEASLGRLVAKLTGDGELPRCRIQPQNAGVGLLASVIRRFAPTRAGVVDAAEPIAHHVATTLVKGRERVGGHR